MQSAATISAATRGPRHPARPAGAHRPAGIPALARLAPRAFLPARRAVLDVPGDRSGDLLRVRGGSSSRRCGSCSGRRRDTARVPAPRPGEAAQIARRGRRDRHTCCRRRGRRRCPGSRLHGAPPALALRRHQPCDDESVLRSDPLRDPGREQALRHELPVDRLDAQRRGRDGQGDAACDRGRRRTASRSR